MPQNYKPLPDSLTIKESDIQGLGVFAIKDIANDVDLGLTHIEVDDEVIRTPLGGFINHSDEPNCIKVKETVSVDGDRYTLYTLRDIKVGEEITLRYTLYNL